MIVLLLFYLNRSRWVGVCEPMPFDPSVFAPSLLHSGWMSVGRSGRPGWRRGAAWLLMGPRALTASTTTAASASTHWSWTKVGRVVCP